MKMIAGFALFVVMAIVGLMIVPVYFSNYQFEDSIKNEALQSTYGNRTEEDIRDSVIKHGKEYDIPLTAKQVHVSRTGSNGSGTLSIEVDYSVPVDLPGYPTTFEFHPSSKNKGVF
jgi:YbbR domain-containing protein